MAFCNKDCPCGRGCGRQDDHGGGCNCYEDVCPKYGARNAKLFSSLVKTSPPKPEDFDDTDEQALREEFGAACSCRSECPLCNSEQFTLWWIRRQAEKKTRFDRPDVV